MKVVHFVNGRCNFDSANGVDKTIFYLAREVADQGVEVHLISATSKDLIPIEGVEVHKVAPFTNGYFCPSEVKDLIDKISPDVGHLHSVYVPENIAVGNYFRKTGIPYVVTPNGNCSRHLLRRRPWLKIPYKYLVERPYLNRASLIQSVGDKQEITHYGVNVPLMEALNGIDLETLPDPDNVEQNALDEVVPKFKGEFVCVFVGRLDIEQKGLDMLVEAMALFKDRERIPRLVLIGPSWKNSRERIEEMIKAKGVEDYVYLHGPAYGEEKYRLLKSGDAFIHASRWEGLPFAVVEAMAMKQLCIVTPAADPAGLVESRNAGISCEESASGLAAGIQRAMDLSAIEKEEVLSHSAEVVENEMNWQKIASRMIDGYRSLVDEC